MRVAKGLFQTICLGFFILCGSAWGYVSSGSQAPQFKIRDISGTEHSLKDYQGRVVVLEWVNPKCPYSLKHYSKEIANGIGDVQGMQKDFMGSPNNVVWMTISSASKGSEGYYTSEEWGLFLQKTGATPTALLLDEFGDVAKLYSVRRTPEVLVIDRDGIITYRGAIDSMRGSNPREIDEFANLPWLRHAIEQTLKGGVVAPAETIPYGCVIPL